MKNTTTTTHSLFSCTSFSYTLKIILVPVAGFFKIFFEHVRLSNMFFFICYYVVAGGLM